jgi:hypothetical protein
MTNQTARPNDEGGGAAPCQIFLAVFLGFAAGMIPGVNLTVLTARRCTILCPPGVARGAAPCNSRLRDACHLLRPALGDDPAAATNAECRVWKGEGQRDEGTKERRGGETWPRLRDPRSPASSLALKDVAGIRFGRRRRGSLSPFLRLSIRRWARVRAEHDVSRLVLRPPN